MVSRCQQLLACSSCSCSICSVYMQGQRARPHGSTVSLCGALNGGPCPSLAYTITSTVSCMQFRSKMACVNRMILGNTDRGACLREHLTDSDALSCIELALLRLLERTRLVHPGSALPERRKVLIDTSKALQVVTFCWNLTSCCIIRSQFQSPCWLFCTPLLVPHPL